MCSGCRGIASEHLFPQGREDVQSRALTQVGWCPLECWCLGPRTCLLRKLREGTGEHIEVLTGCDFRMRDRLGSRAGSVSALLSAPVPCCGSGPSHSTSTDPLETLLKHKGPTSLTSPRKGLKAIHSLNPGLHSSVPKSYTQH